MSNINEKDLCCRVNDGKRSTSTDEIRNGARHHEGGEDDEGDQQECEPRSGQRRDQVRRKFNSGYSLSFFLVVSSSTCSMGPPL